MSLRLTRALLCLALALAAPPLLAQEERPHRSLKGWELHSWEQGGEWQFTLIEGTNRHKSLEEIADDLDVFTRLRNADGISVAGGDPLTHPPAGGSGDRHRRAHRRTRGEADTQHERFGAEQGPTKGNEAGRAEGADPAYRQ